MKKIFDSSIESKKTSLSQNMAHTERPKNKEHTQSKPNENPPFELSSTTPLPSYLEETYWWAYVHPNAVRFFERQWLVNLILWGNFIKLRNAALAEIGDTIHGKMLQTACVYGDFSPKVAERLAPDASLDIVDVAPIQLKNVHKKIKSFPNVFLRHQDSTVLQYPDHHFDHVIVFFLLHEQPQDARQKTVAEAMRVTKPGGRIIFVDYHRPTPWNPFRYIMIPILHFLEPFALDIWKAEISDWIPSHYTPKKIEKETFFGGLYQKVVCIR
ncbi:rhodoquinone biosynthesis methyltransferase RquA [Magnetococcales bacterium HHB-1]